MKKILSRILIVAALVGAIVATNALPAAAAGAS
jgi:hypothetical protein